MNPNKVFKVFVLLALFISLSLVVSAAPQIAYESAALGRIVGDSAEEMKQQLVEHEISLEHATYYSGELENIPGENKSMEVALVLASSFPDNDIHRRDDELWKWSDVTGSVAAWTKKTFLLIEASGKIDETEVKSSAPYGGLWWYDTLTPDEAGWSNFNNFGQLLFFDSDYAGVHLPKVGSFVGKLNPKSATIAPTGPIDREFVKVFVCNLGKYDTLSETYRNARNNYYWQTNSPSGTSLMAYELYGNPAVTINTPAYDVQEISSICKDYLQNYDDVSSDSQANQKTGVYASSEPAHSTYARDYTFKINDYSVEKLQNYSVITTGNTELAFGYNSLVLPKAINRVEFPFGSVITDISVAELSEPVELIIPDLPSWEGELINRTCYKNTQEAGISYAHSFTEDKEIVAITINPVEVLDCEAGHLRLYKAVKYSVKYIPYSPVLIEEINHPGETVPGQAVKVDVSLKNMQTEHESGILKVSDSEERIVAEKEIPTDELQHTLEFNTPDEEGAYNYRLEFVQNNESMTYTDFSLLVSAISAALEIPKTVRSNDFSYIILNNKALENIEIHIDNYLIKDGNAVAEKSVSVTIPHGETKVKVAYNTVPASVSGQEIIVPFIPEKEDQQYDLLVNLRYGDAHYTLTDTLVTNHPPVLKQHDDITVYEWEKVKINPYAYDLDGDQLVIEYSGDMGSDTWETEYGDADDYEVTIKVSDGLLTDEQTIAVHVLESNDADGDGYRYEEDCDDSNTNINPDAEELCNNIDDNCDGEIDEDACEMIDLAVSAMGVEPETLQKGEDVKISVSVASRNLVSGFYINLDYGDGSAEKIMVQEEITSYNINTAHIYAKAGKYTITANVNGLENTKDINNEDNTLTKEITIEEICACPDINGDGIIDIFDTVKIGINAGKRAQDCPKCDVLKDGFIDSKDIECVSRYFNKEARSTGVC